MIRSIQKICEKKFLALFRLIASFLSPHCQAHNLKVAGSNSASATNTYEIWTPLSSEMAVFVFWVTSWLWPDQPYLSARLTCITNESSAFIDFQASHVTVTLWATYRAKNVVFFAGSFFEKVGINSDNRIALPAARRYAASAQMQSKLFLEIACLVFQGELPGAIRFPCDKYSQFQP